VALDEASDVGQAVRQAHAVRIRGCHWRTV
jgi:hypothetical protein